MAEAEPTQQLVVVGASAGGIDALSTLVGTLPRDFPAPILVALHLDPSRSSHLAEILARRSTLPVQTVEDQQQLDAGTVYVVPSDRHVQLVEGRVQLHADHTRGRPTPSIDLLLSSAADNVGEQLIAVILTGLGSDGADGARHVKELGGAVVIQNPQTAAHPDMPLSLAPTTIDVVAELDAIGPLLGELVAGSYVEVQADDERRLRTLLDQIRTRSGIDFSSYKEPTIRRRLQRRMLDTNNQTLEQYARYLRRHPEEYERLAASFLIKVTDFFRDPDLFTYLREQVLPRVIDDARDRGNELRLWSAGCATGEEAYSLAILVGELLGDELNNFTVRIFATDLDPEAVGFARRGVYPNSALKNVPEETRLRYFTQLDSAWEVRKQLRSMVVFGHHDLAQRAPFPRIDLVLCRNVLIYFTPELQRRSLQLFAFALREDGYLVLGKAEGSSPLPEYFQLVQPKLKVFRRHGERVLIPPSRIRDAVPEPNAALPGVGRPVLAGMDRELARAHARSASGQPALDRSEQVLFELPVGVVVVDARYDIQHINATARRLLGIHTPAIGEDLVHIAYRPLGGPLRDAIDAAQRGEHWRRVHEVTSLPDTPNEVRHFELCSFVARGEAGEREPLDLVVVMISDVTDRERELRERRVAAADADARASRLQELLDQSTRSVRELQKANQDLAMANAGLRGTNEELLVGNEEAQAGMEEIETLNEEQQATNEELETLNEELQATVEELNATNEDLEARSGELEEQAAARESLIHAVDEQRQRLEAVLGSMLAAVVMVDDNGAPVLTNQAFRELFGDQLPPLEDTNGRRLPAAAHPGRIAARGETFTRAFTIERDDGTRRYFEASGGPIRGDGGRGGVVVITDVSDRSLRELQEQFVALASHELRTPLTALRGSLQMLQRALGAHGEPRLVRQLETAVTQTRLLQDIVQDLADVVRLQTAKLSVVRDRVDLVDITRHAVDLARPMDSTQELRMDAPSGQVLINGDTRRLQQVVVNLVANALQHGASPRGVDVRVRTENGMAVLEVTDYGAGIAPENRQHVFDRFFHVDTSGGPTGLGLGLYLAKSIVVAHDGTIDVDSNSGKPGTTFIVRLSLAEPSP
ncbi:MAG: PAS domain-containing protein [Chloroflexi bacterium]|nr:PAS domain-containing protein [Chloroflexota bacterium]